MRAERLRILFSMLSVFGLVLIRPAAILPAFDFVQASDAGPLPAEQPAVPVADPKAQSAAVEHELPAFVPEHQILTFSSDGEAEPDGQTKAATANPKEQSKAPEWPEFFGAKKLFGAVKEPAPLAARAIGTYAHGCLSGAVALPIDGPAWQEMRLSRNRNWGHPKLIALIEQFAKDAQKLDGWPGLLVGDIAQPRGGPMITGHASHQVGLDADIWLTPMPNRRLTAKEREDIQATSMLDKTSSAVDPRSSPASRSLSSNAQRPILRSSASSSSRRSRRHCAKRPERIASGSAKCGPSMGTTIISMCVSNARRDLPAVRRKRLRRAPTVVEKKLINGWRA